MINRNIIAVHFIITGSSKMYVCLCNGITDRQIQSAIQNGATSVSRVYRSQDCTAQCGKCSCQIKDMIRGQAAHTNPSH